MHCMHNADLPVFLTHANPNYRKHQAVVSWTSHSLQVVWNIDRYVMSNFAWGQFGRAYLCSLKCTCQNGTQQLMYKCIVCMLKLKPTESLNKVRAESIHIYICSYTLGSRYLVSIILSYPWHTQYTLILQSTFGSNISTAHFTACASECWNHIPTI